MLSPSLGFCSTQPCSIIAIECIEFIEKFLFSLYVLYALYGRPEYRFFLKQEPMQRPYLLYARSTFATRSM
ncbi:hypothetical protein ANRL3_01989 [Anaerolineae bacterium]|nr:hypothetical protein ANRL3_01989 [Anaerolineae bacterium]